LRGLEAFTGGPQTGPKKKAAGKSLKLSETKRGEEAGVFGSNAVTGKGRAHYSTQKEAEPLSRRKGRVRKKRHEKRRQKEETGASTFGRCA